MATTPVESTTTPPSTPVIHASIHYDNLNESWCELQYKSGCSSTGSISHLNHSVNPEILEKLLQEAQRDSLLASNPSSPKPYLPTNKSTIYYDHHIETSTPILVDLDTCCATNDLIMESNLTSPIKLVNSPPMIASDDDQTNFETEQITQQNIKSFHINAQSSTELKCSHCARHQKQIDILLEKQIDQEKLLINLRKEYEQKLLTKSPEFTLTSSQSSSSASDTESEMTTSSNSKRTSLKDDSLSTTTNTLLRQNSSSNTLIANSSNSKQTLNNYNNNTNSTNLNCNFGYSSGFYNYNSGNSTNGNNNQDWMKYWSSRPQSQPPKEWNFVHPNSANSKLRKTMENNEDMLVATTLSTAHKTASKLLTRDNIGKLIFTHMASFIVGATLMFLVLRRHLNMRSSIYFV